MRLVWDRRAVHELEEIWAYIARDNMRAAEEMAQLIQNRVLGLKEFPEIGRRGRIRKTRELVVTPYIVIYQIYEDRIGVRAVLHGRRRWPRRL